MEEAYVDIFVGEISAAVDEIRPLVFSNITLDVAQLFSSFDLALSNLRKAFESESKDYLIHTAMEVASISESIGNYTSGLEVSVPFELSKNLLSKSRNLRAYLEAQMGGQWVRSREDYLPDVDILSVTEERLKAIVDEQEKHDLRIKKILSENELRVTSLEKKLKDLQQDAQVEIDKITSSYLRTLTELDVKKVEIDKILGHVAGRAVAGDYEKSATEEKRMADLLRWGSLGCMALITFALGSSLFETFGAGFDWQKSIFRVTLGFLLSVPAAYLARESAKHREQQYQHQQTSLDLKAISPFMASLPEEEQHKIKIQIASRVFAGRDFSKVSADPFPLNTQEIIIELIKKLEIPKGNQRAGKTSTPEAATKSN